MNLSEINVHLSDAFKEMVIDSVVSMNFTADSLEASADNFLTDESRAKWKGKAEGWRSAYDYIKKQMSICLSIDISEFDEYEAKQRIAAKKEAQKQQAEIEETNSSLDKWISSGAM